MGNRMAKRKQVVVGILAIALTALLGVTACAPVPTAPSGNEVKIAAIEPITGAAGVSSQIVLQGIEDYLRYFNEQKFISGVSIRLLWGDTMMQYAQLCSHYEKFVAMGVPFIFMDESQGLTALERRFEKDQVVVFAGGAGFAALMYPPDGRYSCAPTLPEQFAVMADYLIENWKEERPPRLAFVALDSPWGRDPIEHATKYAQSLGFELLPPEIVPFVVLDATPNLLRLRDQGADFVYAQALKPELGPMLRDTERLGLLGQIQFTGHPLGMGEIVIEMTGIASEGYLTPRTYPWFDDTDVSGIKLVLDTQMKYHGEVLREHEYFTGWVGAAVACEAIKRAIENVGYDNLNGAAIKEALDNMKDFDVYGLTSITYTPNDHRGSTRMAIYEVREGKLVRVSDWREAPMLIPEG